MLDVVIHAGVKVVSLYLELRDILTEGDVEDPVQSLLGQPSLVQGELPDISRVPGVSLLHQDT